MAKRGVIFKKTSKLTEFPLLATVWQIFCGKKDNNLKFTLARNKPQSG